ncbi:MAG: DNA-binding protein WhiA [Clostridia bacterium]|nr:DNA-binding protein WhiA [Clostridia bacterium]
MSFSSDIKDRISANENSCDFCNRAQLAAMVRYAGRFGDDKIVFATENKNVAECAKELIYKNFGINTEYSYKAKSRLYDIVIDDISAVENICDALMMHGDDNGSLVPFECCVNSYIKGAFLGGGSLSDPHKSYHLEFDSKYQSEAERLCKLLEDMSIPAKITCRKKHYVVYVKEYSAIADVLGIIGDTNSAFDIYNISIEKDVRNNINRQMNCENANMDKIADAYKKHLSAIEKIKKTIGLNKLPDVLQEIAEVRVKYPEDGLKQLGERLEKPIGKSGVNHRLNRIMAIADELE